VTNIKTKVEGSKLIIEIDLTKREGRSKSGKNFIIATTGAPQAVPGAPSVMMGLNVYTKEG
jgi:hypothetical protein